MSIEIATPGPKAAPTRIVDQAIQPRAAPARTALNQDDVMEVQRSIRSYSSETAQALESMEEGELGQPVMTSTQSSEGGDKQQASGEGPQDLSHEEMNVSFGTFMAQQGSAGSNPPMFNFGLFEGGSANPYQQDFGNAMHSVSFSTVCCFFLLLLLLLLLLLCQFTLPTSHVIVSLCRAMKLLWYR